MEPATRAREAVALAATLAARGVLADPFELAIKCTWREVDGEQLVFTTHHLHQGRILLGIPERLTPASLAAGAIASASLADVRRLEEAGCRITATEPFREYIYSARKTAELQGPELENVRRMARKPAADAKVVTDAPHMRIRELLAAWLAARRPTASSVQRATMLLEAREELQALALRRHIPHTALFLEREGRLAGFIIGVPIDGRHWAVPYWKSLPDAKGAAEFLHWQLAQRMPPDALYTTGSDARSGGIAAFKRKFRPVEVRERQYVAFEPPVAS